MGSNQRLAAPQGVSAQPQQPVVSGSSASAGPQTSPGLLPPGFNPAAAPQTMNINAPSGQPAPWASGGGMGIAPPAPQAAVLNQAPTTGEINSFPGNFNPTQFNMPMSGGGTGIAPPAPVTTTPAPSGNTGSVVSPTVGGFAGGSAGGASGAAAKCPTCGK